MGAGTVIVASKTADQCSNGYSCGLACISRAKQCSVTLTGTAADLGGWLARPKRAGSVAPPVKKTAPTPSYSPDQIRGEYVRLNEEYEPRIEAAANDPAERKRLKRELLAAKKQLLIDAITPQVAAARPIRVDGVGIQSMRSFPLEGKTVFFEGDVTPDSTVVRVIRDFIDRPPLPEHFDVHTHTIVFTTQANKEDEYWQKQWDDPDFKSAATGGSGTITFFNDDPDGGGATVVHEMSHIYAEAIWGTPAPPKESAFYQAALYEEPPTEYGQTCVDEDFAESLELFHSDPQDLFDRAPQRYRVLKKMMQDPNFR